MLNVLRFASTDSGELQITPIPVVREPLLQLLLGERKGRSTINSGSPTLLTPASILKGTFRISYGPKSGTLNTGRTVICCVTTAIFTRRINVFDVVLALLACQFLAPALAPFKLLRQNLFAIRFSVTSAVMRVVLLPAPLVFLGLF